MSTTNKALTDPRRSATRQTSEPRGRSATADQPHPETTSSRSSSELSAEKSDFSDFVSEKVDEVKLHPGADDTHGQSLRGEIQSTDSSAGRGSFDSEESAVSVHLQRWRKAVSREGSMSADVPVIDCMTELDGPKDASSVEIQDEAEPTEATASEEVSITSGKSKQSIVGPKDRRKGIRQTKEDGTKAGRNNEAKGGTTPKETATYGQRRETKELTHLLARSRR